MEKSSQHSLDKSRDGIIAFLFGCAQVSLISLNTWQIAHREVIGSLVVGFLISLLWTFNVSNVSRSSAAVKVSYACGATVGTALGMVLSSVIY